MRRAKHFDAKTRRLIAAACGRDERTIENVLDGKGQQKVAAQVFAVIKELGYELPPELSK